jgi:hypothetical protein
MSVLLRKNKKMLSTRIEGEINERVAESLILNIF